MLIGIVIGISISKGVGMSSMSNQQKQRVLIDFGLLDPPVDGLWGMYSKYALEIYTPLYGLIDRKVVLPPTIRANNNEFLDKIINYMYANSYYIARGKDRYNIIYIEGVDKNGNLNNDNLNEWNDRRIVFSVPDMETAVINGNWLATTEPGKFYTDNPMNIEGAFRIAFGQYKSWCVGVHGRNPYLSLVQCDSIRGYRDKNKDGKRTGDSITEGSHFGINQHHGWDMDYVGRNSAGCLVGQSIEGHLQFMSIVTNDIRYRMNSGYKFFTTIIPGDQL